MSDQVPEYAAPVEILLVEDSPTDALLTTKALEAAEVLLNLHHVKDGVEAMEFLRREGDYPNAPRPDLVLLDLNMPRMDGREVLSALEVDADLKRIPVIVLTSSEADEDILDAYNRSANCYIHKPVNFDEFLRVVRSLDEFWFTVVKLPPSNP